MPDYYTKFSIEVPITPEERVWLEAELQRRKAEYEVELRDLEFEYVLEDKTLAIYSEGFGSPGDAADFLETFLQRWHPDKAIALEWACDCSRPVVNAFRGGAALIRATGTEFDPGWIDDQVKQLSPGTLLNDRS